jgi:hypothetical protein
MNRQPSHATCRLAVEEIGTGRRLDWTEVAAAVRSGDADPDDFRPFLEPCPSMSSSIQTSTSAPPFSYCVSGVETANDEGVDQ